MLRLGTTGWWLSLDANGETWAVLRVVAGKRPRTIRVARCTSWKHALQVMENTPKASRVPKGAIEALREMVRAIEAGDALLSELPGEPSESSGAAGDGDARTEPRPPEDDGPDEPDDDFTTSD